MDKTPQECLSSVTPMDNIPTELRCMIGSYLTKQDRSNLKLPCRKFYACLSKRLENSCALKATICLECWGSRISYANSTKLLFRSLSKVADVNEIKLKFFLTEITHRWEKVTTLSLECSEQIAVAALKHCDPAVLKSVSLSSWCENDVCTIIAYLELQSVYSARPQALETLSLRFERRWKPYKIYNGINEQAEGIEQVAKNFPGLKHLCIHGPRYTNHPPGIPRGEADDDTCYMTFCLGVDELCEALNSSSVEHFAIEMTSCYFSDEFKALAIAIDLHDESSDEYERFFDNRGFLEEWYEIDEAELEQWYSNVTDSVIEACPNLRTVRVLYKGSRSQTEPAAYFYGHRLDDGGTFTQLLKGEWDHGFETGLDLTS
ncbi:hypothetical protein FVEN_g3179 [Fusarium venenatum]|nr:hypothetical protein FVEN_g3179 [Fusarium venenatum]